MSPQPIAQTRMTEAQIEQLIKNLANTFGYPIRSPILRRPEEYGLEYEEVSFPSMDGIPLEAWFLPADSDKLVIANHPLWFNRYGFPAHLEPWKQIGAAGGNDFEVNFMPDYKHLNEAGYNVLCYDMRNFGHSGAANGGVGSNGIFESRDVVGSLQYVKRREDLRRMTVGFFSRCCGANATMIAMAKLYEVGTDTFVVRDGKIVPSRSPARLRRKADYAERLKTCLHFLEAPNEPMKLAGYGGARQGVIPATWTAASMGTSSGWRATAGPACAGALTSPTMPAVLEVDARRHVLWPVRSHRRASPRAPASWRGRDTGARRLQGRQARRTSARRPDSPRAAETTTTFSSA
jgi:hypothetical protein